MSDNEEARDHYSTLMQQIKDVPTCAHCTHSVGVRGGLSCKWFNVTLIPHATHERAELDRYHEFMRQQASGCPQYRREPGVP